MRQLDPNKCNENLSRRFSIGTRYSVEKSFVAGKKCTSSQNGTFLVIISNSRTITKKKSWCFYYYPSFFFSTHNQCIRIAYIKIYIYIYLFDQLLYTASTMHYFVCTSAYPEIVGGLVITRCRITS